MDRNDWEAWSPGAPPRDFAERVVGLALRERRASRAWVPVLGVLVASAAAAAVILAGRTSSPKPRGFGGTRGDVVSTEGPLEVRIGMRAIAVLDKGAHVSWDGDAIHQVAGAVFWRVEPVVAVASGPAPFVVHTPAADVRVKGTCFRVTVEEAEMTRRDVVAGAVGAVASGLVLVGVYEGKVAVAGTAGSAGAVELSAGQSARADEHGVQRIPSAAAGGLREDPGASTAEDEPWRVANQNLSESVADYRRRLEVLGAEKTKLERRLGEAEQALARSDGGKGGLPKSEYDLDQQDWKNLADQGVVKLRYPCEGPNNFNYSPGSLSKLGLDPKDGPVVASALASSFNRTWSVIRPLCAEALGASVATADKVGENACVTIMRSTAGPSAGEITRQVAEIRAGERPLPGAGETVDPFEQALLALTGEPKQLQAALTQSLGPDDAKALMFGEAGCWNNQSWGEGPRGK